MKYKLKELFWVLIIAAIMWFFTMLPAMLLPVIGYVVYCMVAMNLEAIFPSLLPTSNGGKNG